MTTFKEWMTDTYEEDTLRDIVRHGCQGGFPGLTYYKDTTSLYDEHESEIWERASQMADDIGHANIFELLASFNNADGVWGVIQFKNLMAWFMAEETAREIVGDE